MSTSMHLLAIAAATCACGGPRVDTAPEQRRVNEAPVMPDAGVRTTALADATAAIDSAVDAAVAVDAAPPAHGDEITYVHGAGGARDPAKVEAAQRRCDANDVVGCHALGLALMTPSQPDSPNNKLAFAAFDKGCNGGYAPSCNGVGVMYSMGLSVPRDKAKAVAIQIKACEAGSETGCVHVAIAYEQGQGVPKNEAKADEYYARACKLGSTPYCRPTKREPKNAKGRRSDP